MSQLESILRESKPAAPAELRERVRLVAAQAPPERRPFRWKRPVLVAVPLLAAAVVAAIVLPRHSQPARLHQKAFSTSGSAARLAPAAGVPGSPRLQQVTASLALQVQSLRAVSNATKAAVAIAQSLGGFPQAVDVNDGFASLALRVPRTRVDDAVRRIGALGTIKSESLHVQDLQAGVNGTDRLITGLQQQLATWRVQPQTTRTLRHIDALTARIQQLQRQRATAVRNGRLATVDLTVSRKPAQRAHHQPGPFHGIVTGLRWVGIVLVYAAVFGTPLALLWVAARIVRRRREERLLSRP